MKKITCFIFCLFLFGTSYSQSLTDQEVFSWYANDHFQLHQKGEVMQVSIDKKPWEVFTLKLGEKDLSAAPQLLLRMKSLEAIELKIMVVDTELRSSKSNAQTFYLDGSDDFKLLTFDFADQKEIVDLHKISHIHFQVNPGQIYTGEVAIQDLRLGKPPVELSHSNLHQIQLFPNPTTEMVNIRSEKLPFDEVEIVQLSGSQLIQKSFSPQHHYRLNLQGLLPGVYLLRVANAGQFVHSEVIIHQAK